ncbi:MAG: hypothetical protein MZW92_77255 [Comamonadaceae bacterium]|nr:hypothetical protein [Comamonadaceae bacterium]
MLLATGCGREQVHQQESYVFGTRVEVLIQGAAPDKARAAAAAVLREFDRLHRMLHAWQPSELTAAQRGHRARRARCRGEHGAGRDRGRRGSASRRPRTSCSIRPSAS